MPMTPMQDDDYDIPGFGPEPTQLPGTNPFASVMLGDEPDDMPSFEVGDDGELHQVVEDEELMPAVSSAQHNSNLAELLDDADLLDIASPLLDAVDDDIESRKPWIDRFTTGFRMMGLTQDEIDDGPFPGSSTAVMPLISEACVQFWAKSFSETVPSEGPCKATVLGKPSEIQVDRAKRVADYQNFDMMFLEHTWSADHSKMLFALPYTGSTFKKTFRDQQMGLNRGEYVKAEDFICNYAMSDLQSSPRYTHRLWRTRNQIKKAQFAQVYRDIDLQEPEQEDLPEETRVKAEANDFEPGNARSTDNRYELYEIYCELDLPGDEHRDSYGKKTGIELPYIVTIEKSSQKILSIYRDWKEHDPLCRRNVIFTKYDFLPSDGFYGWGLLHMVGGMQQAATGALRAIIDGAATASLQGGFVTADAALKDQNLILEPGVYKQVNSSLDDLNKAFWSPPFKEPSPVLFQVLGFLVQRVEKFVSTTEMQTGTVDAKNMPVGSTVALLEAGQKVFSTIHRGLHKTLGEELRQRYELIQVYMPEGGYPYDVEGGHQGIFAEDFQPGVMVIPVSDPNIFSDTQRVAQNQAVYELATQNPDILKKREALIRVLKGIKVPDIDALLVDNSPPPPMDPVTEIQALLRGQPVQAYPDQDHADYLKHYWSFLNNPQFGGNPQIQQQIGPTAMALVGQRLAYAWAAGVRSFGVPANLLPPPMQPPGAPPPQPGPSPEAMGPQAGLPPQQQIGPEQIAQMAAQFTQQLTQIPGMPPPPQTGQQGQGGGLPPEMEAQFRDRETTALEQQAAAKTNATNQSTADAARIADIKAQQEQEVLNQKAQATQLAAEKEKRLGEADQVAQSQRAAEIANQAETLQQSREKHAVELIHGAEAHQTQQQAERVKAAVETAALVKASQDDHKQAELTQDKTHEEIKKTKVMTKQAAKPKPAPKTAKKGAS